MSQTIVTQVLDYMTNKTNGMAVKIAKQTQEIEHLNKEIMRDAEARVELRRQLDQMQEERDCLVKDLRVHQTMRRQMEDRLERGEQLLEQVYNLTSVFDCTGGDKQYYALDDVQPIKAAISKHLCVAPLEPEPARAS